ncbi:AAA domain-containing protein [Vibrio diazotrophicus]|uniref:AAA domain-containing protein n=1 Tax=Vibrio diazotrophicus TaxID=685 RepID=A0A329E8B6_VIBDI|nr:AAA family ATPase [Vibrio diazotrophicus]RAS60495.1 AAA domain-containing protein [Vibrio diazotrophicus]
MKVKSIEIRGIGGIESLDIDFNESMNFICGPNGIGKTTLLECVAHSFSYYGSNILKRNVSSESGSAKSIVEIDGVDTPSNISIENFDPNKASQIRGLLNHSPKLLSLKVTRTFGYQSLDAVRKDANKNRDTSYQEARIQLRSATLVNIKQPMPFL